MSLWAYYHSRDVMEIDIDSVNDIFLLLTIVIGLMESFLNPGIEKEKEAFTSAVTSFFCIVSGKWCDINVLQMLLLI